MWVTYEDSWRRQVRFWHVAAQASVGGMSDAGES